MQKLIFLFVVLALLAVVLAEGKKKNKPTVVTTAAVAIKKSPKKTANKPKKTTAVKKTSPKKVTKKAPKKDAKKVPKKSTQKTAPKKATAAKVAAKPVKTTATKKAAIVHTIGTEVNIRAGPCTDKKVVANVPIRTNMHFTGAVKTGCGHTWFAVKGKFGNGYVSSKFVKEGKAPTAKPTHKPNPSNGNSHMSGQYNCGQSYTSGKPTGNKMCVKIDGKPVVTSTAQHFNVMKAAAAKAGIRLAVNSGFRLQSEQVYLYHCYVTKSCNNGNRAAPPGYSNHQNGLAMDINTFGGAYEWLRVNGSKFGFVRTVSDETWHWEYRPGSRCSAFVAYSCK